MGKGGGNMYPEKEKELIRSKPLKIQIRIRTWNVHYKHMLCLIGRITLKTQPYISGLKHFLKALLSEWSMTLVFTEIRKIVLEPESGLGKIKIQIY